MADERVERWVYGAVLALAIAGAAIALWPAGGRDEAATEAAANRAQRAADDAVTAFEGRRGTTARSEVSFEDAGLAARTDLPEGYVPPLPEVPDLASEPPAPRPRAADPRLDDLGGEMRLLSQARELLPDHASEALALLEAHRHRYTQGVLREEREAFTIEALALLEHRGEAERRYYDFLNEFPASAFRARLEEAMQRPPHPVGANGR
ncbi:MAG: hypothetical protein AB7S26_22195 [Sandaracinaceae bacterium]